eukprot:7321981-Ditylum_brightwellii.AAC.1
MHIKDVESKKRMYGMLRQYVMPGKNRTGLSQVDVPEWDKAEFVLLMGITNLHHQFQPLQWWFGMTMFAMLDKLTAWKDHILPVVSHQRVIVKEETEQALFDQHVKHFSQAETDGTPFTTGQLKALRKYAETALEGEFRTSEVDLLYLNLDKYTAEFVKELKCIPEDPPEIDTKLTTSNIKENYKN